MPDNEADTGIQQTIQAINEHVGWKRALAGVVLLLTGCAMFVIQHHDDHLIALGFIGAGLTLLGLKNFVKLMPFGGKK